MTADILDTLIWALLGGLIGWIAAMLFPYIKGIYHLLIVVVGSGGAVLGGQLAASVSVTDTQGFVAPSFFIAIIGATTMTSILSLMFERLDK